ncbi:MAG: alpha/beta hydrolase [Limnochordaceae bacterium]|nr:alpha/beta hydrolase [Limnochordaceae bacterium]
MNPSDGVQRRRETAAVPPHRSRSSQPVEPLRLLLPDGRPAFSLVARGLWGMRLHFVLYDPDLAAVPEEAPTYARSTAMDSLCQPRPTIVFVHGFQSDWQAWKDVLSRLGSDHRAIALDLPGHGHSAKPLTTYTIPFYARAVASFLAYLRRLGATTGSATATTEEPRQLSPKSPAPLTLAGVSLGGAIAARTALDYPFLVDRLVLVDAAGIGKRPQPWSSRRRFLPMLFWQILGRPQPSVIRSAYQSSLFHRPKKVQDALVNETIATQRACRLASLLTGITLGLPSARTYADLPRLQQPTLLVWGRHDRVFALQDALEAQTRIPHAKLVVIEDAGHVPMQEVPEAFARALRQFIQEE